MTHNELKLHFEHVRQMQKDLRDLNERIYKDKSDDASDLRRSYEKIQKEIRYLLSRHYNVEVS